MNEFRTVRPLRALLSIALIFAVLLLQTGLLAARAAAPSADGEYLTGRITSYANPETGKTVDGGTNIALGDSMCANILDPEVGVKIQDGRTFFIMGIGMQDYVENVRVEVQNNKGSYVEVPLTEVGKGTLSDDPCTYYAFEVPSADSRFSPIFYVGPMERDVQFFAQSDGTFTEGSGKYADMFASYSPSDPIDFNASSGSHTTLIIVICATVVALALIACLVWLLLRKRKKGKSQPAEDKGETHE